MKIYIHYSVVTVVVVVVEEWVMWGVVSHFQPQFSEYDISGLF